MPPEPKKRKTARDRLGGMVDKTVSVLDEERSIEEPAFEHTIESAEVRAALRRNRQYGDLPLKVIEADPEQVRKVDTTSEAFAEFAGSIREHGVLEPITVRWIAEREVFQVVTGERRFRAAQVVGLEMIPAIVRELSDTTKAIHQLVENIQREDMNPIDEAKAFRRYLAATGGTQEALAKAVGKSKAYVSQIMSLLEKLTREEQDDLSGVSPAKLPGKSLILEAIRIPDPEIRRSVLRGELTRDQARKQVPRPSKAPQRGRPKHASKSFSVDDPPATVTVRLKTGTLDEDAVLRAIQAALRQQRKQSKSQS